MKNWIKRFLRNAKFKLKGWGKELLTNSQFVEAVFCLFLLVCLVFGIRRLEIFFLDKLDSEMLVSVVIAFLLASVSSLIARSFVGFFEDSTKLTDDIDGLAKQYSVCKTMLPYQNAPDARYKKGRRKTRCQGERNDQTGDSYTIPVADVCRLVGKPVILHDDPNKKYTPPEFSQKHYGELLAAHDASKTFNQVNLRVDAVESDRTNVHIWFSRTTYFDSLVTNRAIDYHIENTCVRDLYAYGPWLATLRESKLSNHMGFNGMVETSDNKFVFIKRHKHVSIGKNTMQCSVAASLKAKYALNAQGVITKQGIEQAIINEIADELNLKNWEHYKARKAEIFRDFSFEKNVLFFYRDLLEGGKPQLMFYAKLNLTSEELKEIYTIDSHRRKHSGDEKMICQVDGYKMQLVSREDIRKVYLTPDTMVIHKKAHRAMPSAVGTVAMLIKAMDEQLI